MRTLKVGIVGCGRIATLRHAPEYARNPACELKSVFDIDPARAKALADAYGAKAYSTLEALLDSDIDAASVCTANHYHAQNTIQLLRAGKHVLCEKPMAVTAEDCEAMVREAARANKRLFIGLNQRFPLTHTQARERIRAGEIGTPLTFQTRFAHPGPEIWTGSANTWFFDKNVAAFGAMADLGVHKVDLIHYLLGEHTASVMAQARTLDKKLPDGTPIGVDDNCFCILCMESGAVGTVHAGWTNYGAEDNSTVICGTKGAIKLFTDPTHSLIIEHRDGSAERLNPDSLLTNDAQLAGKTWNTGVIDEFTSAILADRPSRIDASEAIYAMRVLFAAAKSSENGAREYL